MESRIRVLAAGMQLAVLAGMSKRLPAVVAMTIAVAGGCATAEPVIRLTPESNDVVWVGGSAAVIKKGISARVAVAFARAQDELVGFRVEIENGTTGPILIDPAKFYYAACVRSDDGNSRQCHPAHPVVDPEKVLLDLDIRHSRDKASNANAETLAATMLFPDLATTVAGAASGKHHTTAVGLNNAVAAGDALGAIQAEGQVQASSYEIQRANWETAAFRKSTILPGNRVAGLVFVDRDLTANEVRLEIRIGDDVLDFPFKQTLYQAQPQRSYTSPDPMSSP